MKQYNSCYTVIIPVFNGLRFIDKCLEDHINQSYKPKSIIIIDDGSSLNEKIHYSKITKIINDRLDFQLITHKKNFGGAAAVFTGLKYVKTKYFKISAVDDLVEKNLAEESINLIKKNPQAGFVFSLPSMYIYKKKKINKYTLNISKIPCYFSPQQFKKIVSKKIFKIYSNTIFFETKKFTRYNIFDQRYNYLSDSLNNYYIAFKYGACFLPDHLGHFGIHDKQIVKNIKNKSLINLKSLILLKKEHNEFFNTFIKCHLAYDIYPFDLIKILFTKNREIFSIKVFFRSITFNIWRKVKFFVPPSLVSLLLKFF